MMPGKIGSGVAIAWASYSCAAGLHYTGRDWTRAHRRWIARLAWTQPAERAVGERRRGQCQGQQYEVAPDGRFLINTVLDKSATAPNTLLTNWNPEAKKQSPPR